ncbi:MAG: M20/M25/M40 family metallo-hydrolase [Thermoanaerobaculia bacterium]
MTIDPVRLARELIDIPSPSGAEGVLGQHLHEYLREFGFSTSLHEVEPGRWNVLARGGGTPRVVLCTHIDTVPPVFPSRIQDGWLYGRGACDTKGILAAMITAGARLIEKKITDFALLLVVAEETDSIGAKKANREFADLGSKAVIVGEPTQSRFVRATKGALTATVRFEGIAAHSAYPERGESAILKMASAIQAIAASVWGDDPVLGRGTANVGVVRGGEKANIIPASAEFDVIFRIVEQPAAVLERLGRVVAPFGGTITHHAGNAPVHMAVPPDQESTVAAFNTDVPHLSNLGVPILFGPGSILDAHSAAERIAIDDLLAAVTVYEELVTDILDGKVRLDGRPS